MRPLWDWHPLSWMLTGLPGYALFVLLGHAAADHGWWSDPFNYWATGCGLIGLLLGAGLWALLVNRSERRSRR